MAVLLKQHPSRGGPGTEPRWTRSDKDGVGTAYSALCRIWFTVSKGIVNEVYYPTIDRPQIRDLQYMVTDGQTFFRGERQLDNQHERLADDTLGYRITNTDPEGRFRIVKEVIADPHRDCLLIDTSVQVEEGLASELRMYALLAPHLELGGWDNNGNVAETPWGKVLTAHKGSTWLVLACSTPFANATCGYVGVTDGWQDLERDFRISWEYDSAESGNIALTGEIDVRTNRSFTLVLAFGDSLHRALVNAYQSLAVPFADQRARFIRQWQRARSHLAHGVEEITRDGGRLYHISHSLILAHEDKTFDGALIASLSIPWGQYRCDKDTGGYHLVWTRDMCQSALGLLAAGSTEAPLRALIYLACTQREDGGFYQNFWINGEPYWRGTQLDETAFPILLAWQLGRARALADFDPYPLVVRAARFLIENGPVTPQERWEENSGYSPSTLAVHIAALVCAAAFARQRGDPSSARYLEEYADFLEAHLEAWTVTTEGTLLPGVKRHFIRIQPVDMALPAPVVEDPNSGVLPLANQPPGAPRTWPAKDIVDAGFLALVRYGIRRPDDPLIEDSLRVVDAVLRIEFPMGPCWRRYNHDGYGQREDGGPFSDWGKGHAWPLLTGERGHYELAAGRDVLPFIHAMERVASTTGLLPEQLWSEPDLPDARMFRGRPTGGAMPLVWAHAEYIRLVRSAADGKVFDLIPEVGERYLGKRAPSALEIWQTTRQIGAVRAGTMLRIQGSGPFELRWTRDEWQHSERTPSTPTGLGPHFVDITVPSEQRAPLRFTFLWTDQGRWEGRDYVVTMR
jgi:glucoamylase